MLFRQQLLRQKNGHKVLIVDDLNNEFKTLLEKYNEKLRGAFSAMGLDCNCQFDDYHTFYSPCDRDDYGDIHVGKISGGWKPLMQANEHFHSLQTLKQWYEQNKSDYNFIDEYGDIVKFEEYIEDIAKRNQDEDLKGHSHIGYTDGYDWEHRVFS